VADYGQQQYGQQSGSQMGSREEMLATISGIFGQPSQISRSDKDTVQEAVAETHQRLMSQAGTPSRRRVPTAFSSESRLDQDTWGKIADITWLTAMPGQVDDSTIQQAKQRLDKLCQELGIDPKDMVSDTYREIVSTLLSFPGEVESLDQGQIQQLDQQFPQVLTAYTSQQQIDPSRLDDITFSGGTSDARGWGQLKPKTRDDWMKSLALVTFPGIFAQGSQTGDQMTAERKMHEELRRLMGDMGARGQTQPTGQRAKSTTSDRR